MDGDGARTTMRLTLRPPGPADAPGYRALLMHPTIGEWLRPPPERPFTPADGDAWLGEDERHWERYGFGPWAVTESADGDYLGRIGLKWTEIGERAGVEVVWAVDPARHGEGFAGEAAGAALDLVGELGLDEVFAMILPSNQASRRVAEKLGLEPVGNVEHAGFDHHSVPLRPAAGARLDSVA